MNFITKIGLAIVFLPFMSHGQQDTGKKTPVELPFAIAREKRLPNDELAEKKEGVYFTGVPDISSDPINGFGYGAEGEMYFNGKKTDPFFEYTPYRAALSLALFNTTKSQREIKLGLDVPYIFSTKWRLRAEAAYETDPNFLYFGNTEKNLQPLSYFPDGDTSRTPVTENNYENYSNSLVGRQKYWNTYTKTEAVLNVSAERSFYEGRLRALVGYEIASISISTPLNDSGSLLHSDQKAGKIKGLGKNIISLLQLGLVYDTRDLETDPTKGIFAEVTHEVSLNALGSQYNFSKTFFHFNGYHSLFRKHFKRLVLCESLGLGVTQGDAPFFEYPDVWSSEGDIDGMGGSKTLRGYKQGRFAAPVMQFVDIELRYRFAQLNLWKQHFTFAAVPFFDVAGVWNSLDRIGHLENYRHSEGAGLRIAWNVNTILRFDYAISKEDAQFFFQLGHTF